MSKLLARRASVVLAATLFAAASWFNASLDTQTPPTSLVLSQPEPELNKLAVNTGSQI